MRNSLGNLESSMQVYSADTKGDRFMTLRIIVMMLARWTMPVPVKSRNNKVA